MKDINTALKMMEQAFFATTERDSVVSAGGVLVMGWECAAALGKCVNKKTDKAIMPVQIRHDCFIMKETEAEEGKA